MLKRKKKPYGPRGRRFTLVFVILGASFLERYPNSQSDRLSLIDFQGGCLRDIGS
jgi:hypothetical protein